MLFRSRCWIGRLLCHLICQFEHFLVLLCAEGTGCGKPDGDGPQVPLIALANGRQCLLLSRIFDSDCRPNRILDHDVRLKAQFQSFEVSVEGLCQLLKQRWLLSPAGGGRNPNADQHGQQVQSAGTATAVHRE